jgi:hypothetical protein
MAFRPDYGLALLRSGVNRDFQSSFYALHLDHITAISANQFTTLITIMLNGAEHALSLDFTTDELNDILEHALPRTAARVRAWVQQLRSVGTLEIPERIMFGAHASFGKEQQAEKERYLPFVIQKVFACSPHMSLDDFGILMVVVSRHEVDSGDTSRPLSTLKHLISSQQMIQEFRTRVDIAFDGYNETRQELFEMPEVRNYVYALDEQFPYWLYFLSRHYTGLQCITLCSLPPYLTDAARLEVHPQRIGDLIERRWGPALNQICAAAGLPNSEADALLESALTYYKCGPIRPLQ